MTYPKDIFVLVASDINVRQLLSAIRDFSHDEDKRELVIADWLAWCDGENSSCALTFMRPFTESFFDAFVCTKKFLTY